MRRAVFTAWTTPGLSGTVDDIGKDMVKTNPLSDIYKKERAKRAKEVDQPGMEIVVVRLPVIHVFALHYPPQSVVVVGRKD